MLIPGWCDGAYGSSPCCPHPPTLSPGVWMTEGVRMEWKLEFSGVFREHRLTFLELKEALRNAPPSQK